jgi:hypothetical protein
VTEHVTPVLVVANESLVGDQLIDTLRRRQVRHVAAGDRLGGLA